MKDTSTPTIPTCTAAVELASEEATMQQPGIVVYVTPSCPQCMLTKKVLDAKGVTYQVVDVTQNANALAYVQDDLGYSQAPVVVVSDEDHWSGFRPDLIATHIAA